MAKHRITLEKKPAKKDLRFIEEALSSANIASTANADEDELVIFARDAEGALIGACLGAARWRWLHVRILWVAPSHREKKLGSQLLRKAEQEGRRLGCRAAYLSTFSFQAKPFYRKHGYRVFGSLKGFPPPHTRWFMKKPL